MSRQNDLRGAARRGSDNQDTGYGVAIGATAHRGKRWPAPADIHGITRYMRQRQATGRCVVCNEPTDTPGVTCKKPACVACWVLGHTGGAT